MNFDQAVDILLSDRVEGGYSNNPHDPGGETMWGITRKTAIKHGYEGSMRIMTKDTAKAIYLEDYWMPQQIDRMPDKLRYIVFDCCVNEGPGKAVEFLRECLGLAEGGMDAALITAILGADLISLLAGFMGKRTRHYASLATWGMFGRGWANRIATNLEVVATGEMA